MAVNEVYNNTILLPASDGLVKDNPLPANDTAETIALYNSRKLPDAKDTIGLYLIVPGEASLRFTGIQEISGLSMKRENEQIPSPGRNDWVVNLPGNFSYGNVTIKHIFTRDRFFLDWLTSGAIYGGSPRADLQIVFFPNLLLGGLRFTLRDAFPVSWSIDDLDKDGKHKDEKVLETVEFAFSNISAVFGGVRFG